MIRELPRSTLQACSTNFHSRPLATSAGGLELHVYCPSCYSTRRLADIELVQDPGTRPRHAVSPVALFDSVGTLAYLRRAFPAEMRIKRYLGP
jgi:hypothetical protein